MKWVLALFLLYLALAGVAASAEDCNQCSTCTSTRGGEHGELLARINAHITKIAEIAKNDPSNLFGIIYARKVGGLPHAETQQALLQVTYFAHQYEHGNASALADLQRLDDALPFCFEILSHFEPDAAISAPYNTAARRFSHKEMIDMFMTMYKK
eukprot:Phypoly_transcript_22484.p1 GENE.Phypoly_transcript_22484~~Phypoly_transcript_22484.p1  ORF type:complete len:155 (+),score=30.13 Phypoly_transcript_22484:109-573(+)